MVENQSCNMDMRDRLARKKFGLRGARVRRVTVDVVQWGKWRCPCPVSAIEFAFGRAEVSAVWSDLASASAAAAAARHKTVLAMNSYFDHSTGFYNPAHQAAAEAHQAAYRTFSQSLSTLAAPQAPYPHHQSSWSNGSTAHHSEASASPYVDPSCKIYYTGSQQQAQYKSDCALATKDTTTNGFKSPELPPASHTMSSSNGSSSSWSNHSQSIRSSSQCNVANHSFIVDTSNACPSRSESCSACYVSSPSVPQGNLSTTIINLISFFFLSLLLRARGEMSWSLFALYFMPESVSFQWWSQSRVNTRQVFMPPFTWHKWRI